MRNDLRRFLSNAASSNDLYFPNSYDVVGDIAVLRLPEKSERYGPTVAEAIMKLRKNVKTVLLQTSAFEGDFRLRKLKHLAGENKTATVHKESCCSFSVDLEKCYFSPRLSFERMRVAKQVEEKECVVNMFAGVGCFSVLIAKYSCARRVYSIDINPYAVKYMQENTRLNNVFGTVVPMLGDAKDVIQHRLCHLADRVLLPLPEKAYEYLPYAMLALKGSGGSIHYYDFEHAKKGENPVEKAKLKVAGKLESSKVAFDFAFGRIVRATGPNWYQVVLDIDIEG